MSDIINTIRLKLENRDFAPISGDLLVGLNGEETHGIQKRLNAEGIQVSPKLTPGLESFWAFKRHSTIGTLMYRWRKACEDNATEIEAILYRPVKEARPKTLRQLREEAGLSQKEAASLMEVSQPLYCNIELGKRRLFPEEAAMLAKGFIAEAEDLLESWKAEHSG